MRDLQRLSDYVSIALMDDPRWIRLVTIGLILAAVAVGYFLISGRLFTNSSVQTQPQEVSVVESSTPSPSVMGENTASSASPSPAAQSAFNTAAQRAQGSAQTLPNTGFQLGLIATLAASAAIAGWGLRRFPH